MLLAARSKNSMSPTEKVRVLIVDDDVGGGDALAQVLSNAGCEPLVLRRPDDAVAQALEFSPQAALLDLLFLDSTSGLDLAREIRAEHQLAGIRLAALSGFADEDERIACRDAGFDFHFAKPADPAMLIEFVHRSGSGHGFEAASPALRAHALVPIRALAGLG